MARSHTLFGILALTIACVGSATAQTTERPGGSAVVVLTVRVPSVVRVSLTQGRVAPDGNPILQVVSNDPAIRRMAAHGIAPEEIQGLAVQFSGIQHSKGGEQSMDGAAQVTSQVVRYTIVQP